MAINNIIIVGCNIIGLYSALRCVDNGYRVSIVDKSPQDKVSINRRNNYRIFNKSHQIYIQLLNKFSIKYEKYILKYNEKTTTIISGIIYKSKLIPNKSLNSQSFVKFCRSILTISDYNVLKNNLDAFEHIYSNISAMDALIMLSGDLNASQDYYILMDDISVLIERITQYLKSKNVDFHYNTEIRDILFCNNIIYSSTRNNTFISNIMSSFSRHILLLFDKYTPRFQDGFTIRFSGGITCNIFLLFNISKFGVISLSLLINMISSTYSEQHKELSCSSNVSGFHIVGIITVNISYLFYWGIVYKENLSIGHLIVHTILLLYIHLIRQ